MLFWGRRVWHALKSVGGRKICCVLHGRVSGIEYRRQVGWCHEAAAWSPVAELRNVNRERGAVVSLQMGVPRPVSPISMSSWCLWWECMRS